MQNLTLLFFLLLFTGLKAQDTLYLSKDYEETSRGEAFYFQIDDRTAPGKQDVVRKTYWINGRLKSQRSYTEKSKKLTPEGLQKHWYENGQLFYSEFFRKGKRHGELLAYWEDGSKRRHDIYKKGKLRSGRVWNEDGQEVEHFPVIVPATFPGGQEAMVAYLKSKCPVPSTQARNTEVRLLFSIRVNKEGYIDKIEIIEGAPHWYNSVATKAISEMPRWNPGQHMGDPVGVFYRLPITFRN